MSFGSTEKLIHNIEIYIMTNGFKKLNFEYTGRSNDDNGKGKSTNREECCDEQ